MAQQTQLKANNEVVSVIAIGATNKNAQTKVVFQVAVNVWVAGGVTLAGGAGQTAISSNFTRCIPTGCFAETEIGQDVIQKLRTMKDQGTLRFEDANQKPVAIPVSFKGFNQAYEALLKQGAETAR